MPELNYTPFLVTRLPKRLPTLV